MYFFFNTVALYRNKYVSPLMPFELLHCCVVILYMVIFVCTLGHASNVFHKGKSETHQQNLKLYTFTDPLVNLFSDLYSSGYSLCNTLCVSCLRM